MNIVVKQNNML